MNSVGRSPFHRTRLPWGEVMVTAPSQANLSTQCLGHRLMIAAIVFQQKCCRRGIELSWQTPIYTTFPSSSLRRQGWSWETCPSQFDTGDQPIEALECIPSSRRILSCLQCFECSTQRHTKPVCSGPVLQRPDHSHVFSSKTTARFLVASPVQARRKKYKEAHLQGGGHLEYFLNRDHPHIQQLTAAKHVHLGCVS